MYAYYISNGHVIYFRYDTEAVDDHNKTGVGGTANEISSDSYINQISEYYTDGTISASYV